jgi:hypothetical protein
VTFETMPSWVLFGSQVSGECVIWASDTLASIDIQRQWYPDITRIFLPDTPPEIITTDIRLKVREFALARGATWEEAFSNLFSGGQWNPDRQPEEIAEGPRAIAP